NARPKPIAAEDEWNLAKPVADILKKREQDKADQVDPAIEAKKEIEAAFKYVQEAPADIQKRLLLGRVLKRNNNLKIAAIEYLDITSINPGCIVAYHEMMQVKPTDGQIDEALVRLVKMDRIKPGQLLTKMALSELYEGKHDYYQAARVL